jgi:hypothetical protein
MGHTQCGKRRHTWAPSRRSRRYAASALLRAVKADVDWSHQPGGVGKTNPRALRNCDGYLSVQENLRRGRGDCDDTVFRVTVLKLGGISFRNTHSRTGHPLPALKNSPVKYFSRTGVSRACGPPKKVKMQRMKVEWVAHSKSEGSIFDRAKRSGVSPVPSARILGRGSLKLRFVRTRSRAINGGSACKRSCW